MEKKVGVMAKEGKIITMVVGVKGVKGRILTKVTPKPPKLNRGAGAPWEGDPRSTAVQKIPKRVIKMVGGLWLDA